MKVHPSRSENHLFLALLAVMTRHLNVMCKGASMKMDLQLCLGALDEGESNLATASTSCCFS
jgi:hypothetical protein